MFYRKIDETLDLALSIPQFAEELYSLTDANRAYLKVWLPWLDSIQCPGDTGKFLERQLQRFSRSEALHLSIFYKKKIAGVLGFNQLELDNGVGHVGYWLGQSFTGKGIMTKAVTELIHLGFDSWPLQRVEIRCAEGNLKSIAISERLHFQYEGTLRRVAKVNQSYQDHRVYSLLKEDLDSSGC